MLAALVLPFRCNVVERVPEAGGGEDNDIAGLCGRRVCRGGHKSCGKQRDAGDEYSSLHIDVPRFSTIPVAV